MPSAERACRVLAALPIVLACCVGAATWLRSPAGAADVAERSGRSLWLGDCATCHGVDGEGSSRGPSLEGVGRASVDFQVATGRMPLEAPDAESQRSDSPYSPTEQQAVIDYATALSGGGPGIPAVDPGRGDESRGGELFRLQCAACHSWAGTGGALVDRAAPPIQPASAVQVAEAVRVGPGEMPALGTAALSDQELDDLVAYTETLDDLDDRGGIPLGHIGPVAEGAVAIVVGLGVLVLAVRWMGEAR